MTGQRLVAHVFSGGTDQAKGMPETVKFRWHKRIIQARLAGHEIIHVTPVWPLKYAPNTGLQILSSEPVFWDPLRTIFDCRNAVPDIMIEAYGSIEILGTCPNPIVSASRAAIEKRCPGCTLALDTIHVDEADWHDRLKST